MQTSLLGLGIALILALVTALVGPLFVDWGHYRASFEREASRMAGLPVRIGGAIDVRILPTPIIVLGDVEAGSRAAPVFGARTARAELSLGSLMRGELRAAVLTLEGPDISLGLDANGQVVARNVAPGADLDRVSIDQIVVTGGTLALEDATSHARTTLENLSFDGEMRALAGALKGGGAFRVAGANYKFRLATSRSEGPLRLHVNLDPVDVPLSFETDGTLTFEAGTPHYEGSLIVSRLAGVQLANGQTIASDPWRLSTKIKADVHSAVMEQVEVQYGPDERSVRMAGAAEMTFGKTPNFSGTLSARQMDLDRAMTQFDATNRLPLAALRGLTESLGDLVQPPMPVLLNLSVDAVTLSGGTLQAVRGDIRFDDGWNIENFEFRAPGYTQVAVSGQIGATPSGAEFSGPVSVDAADPRALLTWLEGFERTRAAIGPLKLRGEVTAGADRLMIDRVHAEADRKSYEGRLGYTYPHAGHAAQLDAAMSASEFDIDAAIAFFNAAFSGTSFERPGEITLAADLGRTKLGGVEATAVKAGIRVDGTGLRIEKLSIGDFGGATINASGQIDISAIPPRGALTLSVGAQKIDGVAALVRKFSPDTADALLRYAARLAPATIESSIKIDPPPANGSGATVGRLAMDGRLGGLQLTMGGDITGTIDKWNESAVKLTAKIGSDDDALLAALGIDQVFGASKRPAALVVAANGTLAGDFRIESKLTGEGLDAGANGKLGFSGNSVSGALVASLNVADLRGLRRDPSALPAALKGNVALNAGTVTLDNIVGTVGGATVRGKIVRDAGGTYSGNIDADRIDAPAFVAAIIGMPAAAKPGEWPAQAFAAGPLAGLRGKIVVDAGESALLPSMNVRKLHGVIGFSPAEIAFDQITGVVGGGALTGKLNFSNRPSGLAARGEIKLANADADAVIRDPGSQPLRGKLSSQVEFEGAGSTPASLIGALRGTGTVTLDKARLPSLDGDAINVAIRAVERGSPVTPQRISDVVSRVMDGGSFSVSSVTAPFEVAAGRVRLGKTSVPRQTADLSVFGSLDLVDRTLDAHMVMTGNGPGTSEKSRPEISVALKGPLDAPRRTIDVSPLVGWLTLQAVDREAKKLEEAEREAKRRERINAELEERMKRAAPATPPEAATPANPSGINASGNERPKASGIETAPLAPIAQ